MRNLIITLVCLLYIMVGQAQAEQFNKEHAMANWMSQVCGISIDVRSVTYVGTHQGNDYFYAPYNGDCQYTHDEANVWKMATAALDLWTNNK